MLGIIVHPGGQEVYPYPKALVALMTFMSQHCQFHSVISSSGKDDKFVVNFVYKGGHNVFKNVNAGGSARERGGGIATSGND